MEIVKLSKRGLREDIESGMKRPQIAEKYQLPVTQVNKAIKMAGLNGMRAKTIKFELVDDEEIVEINEIPQPTAPEAIVIEHKEED